LSSTKVILLIEDNPSDVDLTRRALEKSRIANDLVVAEDGEAALEYLRREDLYELPALALLDLNLPKLSGLEVLRQIRADARTRRLPVVILTSSKEEQDLISGYSLGANSYVRKPVDFVEFAEAVKVLGIYWLMMNQSPPGAAP